MTDNERDKVIDKVRKLMGMATSANEAEAAAFAEKAQALLAEHNLSMSEIAASEKPDDGDFEMDSDLETDSRPWRRSLATMTAKMFFCQYFYTHKYIPTKTRKCGYVRKDIHTFVGAPHNIVVAKLMYQYLTATIVRLSDEGAKKYEPKQRTAFRTSFQHSCADRLAQRIANRIAAAKKGQVVSETTGTNLPALLSLYDQSEKSVNAFMEKELGRALSVGGRTGKITSQEGAAAGRAAGDKIGLDDQIATKDVKALPTTPYDRLPIDVQKRLVDWECLEGEGRPKGKTCAPWEAERFLRAMTEEQLALRVKEVETGK